MSTRATYEIDGHTFYIHHDGYPDGAAMYFHNALRWPEVAEERAPNANFADDFMRANPRAELTPSHDAHADTEFRYTVWTQGDRRFGPSALYIRCESVGLHGENPRTIYEGTLDEFIAQNPSLIDSA